MTIEQIEKVVSGKEYEFLQTDANLGNNIVLLSVGGSHAYGTDNKDSDLDIRGCVLNSKRQILTNEKFEQLVDNKTDTTIYSFNKLIHLLSNANPNTIEMLGCKPEHYLYISSIGQEMLDNSHMFLSKKAVYSFGGYANQQLRRLENKVVREVNQKQREMHILNTIFNVEHTFPEKYALYPDGGIKMYIDKSDRDEYDTEIFIDVNLSHYPLRDYKGMWSDMHNIVKDYSKIGKRNKHAVEHDELGKHMMHLVRLYLMCFDILEKEKIVTYREDDREFLLDIRNGKFLDENMQPVSEFYEVVGEYEKRLKYAKENTGLPENPDYNAISDFVMDVNERVVRGFV